MEPGVEGLEEKVEREEGKEEKEEVEEVDDGQPQLLNYIGEGLEGDLFYESVRWQVWRRKLVARGRVFRKGVEGIDMKGGGRKRRREERSQRRNLLPCARRFMSARER